MDIKMTDQFSRYYLPVFLTGAMALAVGCASTPPPKAQLAVSKEAVANATSAGSNEFAPVDIKTAIEKLNGAERAMSDRDYERARYLAEQAQVDAKLAEAKSLTIKSQKSVSESQESIRALREEMNRNNK